MPITLDAPPVVEKDEPSLTPAAPTDGATPTEKPHRARNEYPEAYDELEALDAKGKGEKDVSKAGEATKPSPAKTVEGATPRDASGKFVKPGEKPIERPRTEVEKEAETPVPVKAKEGEQPAPEKTAKEGEALPDAETDPTAKYQLAHDLRKAFRKLHKEHDALKSETAQLRARSQAKPDEALSGEVKKLRDQLSAAETELRYLDYTKSQEFKDKFEKPYQDAFSDAVEEVRELRVTNADGQSRPATEADFQRILAADHQEVRELANGMFGEYANDVLALRRKLIDMNRNANREAKRYREGAAEREKARAVKQQEEREGLEKLWKSKVAEVGERYKQFFGEVDGDDEYNESLRDGYKRVDSANSPDLPLEEKVTRLAVVRHKAAAFGAQVLLNKRLQARVTELEEALKEYEKSIPAGGKGGADKRVEGEEVVKSADEELDELERKFPTEH